MEPKGAKNNLLLQRHYRRHTASHEERKFHRQKLTHSPEEIHMAQSQTRNIL
jgi:hypothetical protein